MFDSKTSEAVSKPDTGQRLSGVIAAIATPITRAGEPDSDRFIALAEHLLSHGCDGLNILGTTGEATSFTREQRMALMSAVTDAGLPLHRLMVGTGAAAIKDAFVLTRHAAEIGFAGALVLPPFYYKGVSDDGIIRFIAAIVEETRSRPVPIYLYHFPAMSGVPYTVDLVRQLRSEFGDRIAGLKDSSGDLDYARRVAALSPSLQVFPSNEAVLLEARAGVFAGCISATANLNADLCAQAFHAGDEQALAAAVSIRRIFEGRSLVPGVKAVLAHIHHDPSLAVPLPPLISMSENERRSVVEAFDQHRSVPH
jgi:4-hydroxy-tetrahydrodipicolinate synthase